MSRVIGPFTVMDGTPAEEELVVAVAARIPAAMVTRDGPGRQKLYFSPDRQPKHSANWAWGSVINQSAVWVNRSKNSTQKSYLIAHEYFHGWDRRHATSQMRDRIRALMGTTLAYHQGYYGRRGGSEYVTSNKPSEGAADSFARAIGLGRGVLANTYKTVVPPTKYDAFLAVLTGGQSPTPAPPPPAPKPPKPRKPPKNPPPPTPPPPPPPGGGVTAPDPFPSQSQAPLHKPRRRVAYLRLWPSQGAPVTQLVGFGGRIQTGRSLTGGVTVVNGQHGSLWFEVLTVDGQSIEPRPWVSALEVVRARPASSTPTTRAPRSQRGTTAPTAPVQSATRARSQASSGSISRRRTAARSQAG